MFQEEGEVEAEVAQSGGARVMKESRSLWETKTGLVYNFMGSEDYIHKGGFKKHVPLLEEVVVMEGVAYFINEEKPDEINQHIHDFDHQEISVIR
ncbi:hypothetical protein M0R45_011069 [Rubus argutus]|uniref:Uncharacterized protein n=1 Tax=Rubus argutus TaxID=59490 RepID=A0AAW1Y9Y2_RUBAR